MSSCQVCGEDKETIVCSVPGVPWSAAYCQECYEANAHPYYLVVANTCVAGGYDQCAGWWQSIVNDTLSHLEISKEQFDEDVFNEDTKHEEG
tara:strand:+ start:774 stop:1049 length:276 start_codon:yes stop_codon:yes gene_type:complete